MSVVSVRVSVSASVNVSVSVSVSVSVRLSVSVSVSVRLRVSFGVSVRLELELHSFTPILYLHPYAATNCNPILDPNTISIQTLRGGYV